MTIGSIKAMTTKTKVMERIRTTIINRMTTAATKMISMVANKTTTSKMAITSNSNMIANTSNMIKITTRTIHKIMVGDNIIREEGILIMAR